ncbi:hypothetical protein [Polaromonas sp. SM01]|nr:hypothetical protein [Polaromonas sp. SM01]MDW5442605.1 hypothetical protein [Polaromonas sp. SM01]
MYQTVIQLLSGGLRFDMTSSGITRFVKGHPVGLSLANAQIPVGKHRLR